MSDEIKVGDKVRVRKDAPRIYINGFDYTFVGAYSIVVDIEDDNAVIKIDNGIMKRALAIPTKYLVKVEDEVKERKFKRGDRVRVCSKDAEHYGRVGTVIETYPSGCIDVDFGDGRVGGHYYGACFLEPCAEPMEETIKRGYRVDFNQALDARLVTEEIAAMLAQVHWLCPIRFGCDTPRQIGECERVMKMIDKHCDTPKSYLMYAMINGNMQESYERLMYFRDNKRVRVVA